MGYFIREAVITVATDDDLSAVVDLGECAEIVAVVLPTMTSTNITFQANAGVRDGQDALTFYSVVDEGGNAIALTGGTGSAFIALNESTEQLRGLRYVKVGTSAGQAADRTIQLVCKAG